MTTVQRILDQAMCWLWILTYTLVLISTVKYKFPAISLITQLIIAPFEFAVFTNFVFINTQVARPYVLAAYSYWTLVEIAIVIAGIIFGKKTGAFVFRYTVAISVMTCLMIYAVVYKNHMFFFSYFCTLLGEIVWLKYVMRAEYPIKPINFALFVTKFVADAISIPVYYGNEPQINAMILILSVVDLLFVVVYIMKSKANQKTKR